MPTRVGWWAVVGACKEAVADKLPVPCPKRGQKGPRRGKSGGRSGMEGGGSLPPPANLGDTE